MQDRLDAFGMIGVEPSQVKVEESPWRLRAFAVNNLLGGGRQRRTSL
jgi:hypothetical protein